MLIVELPRHFKYTKNTYITKGYNIMKKEFSHMRPKMAHIHYNTSYILFISFALSFILLVYCIITNTFSIMSPKQFSSHDNIDDCYKNGTRYVKCTADNLYYSGYDFTSNDRVSGYYYYSLDDGDCTIYILSPAILGVKNGDTPPQAITSISFKAKLTGKSSNLKSLLQYMADDLDWNYDSLSLYSHQTVVDQTMQTARLSFIIFIIFVISILLNLVSLIIIIFNKRILSANS